MAQHVRDLTTDPGELLNIYRTLDRLGTPSGVLAPLAEHLDAELRPRLQDLLAGLQASDLITMYQVAHRVLDAPSRTPKPQSAPADRARRRGPGGRQHQPIPRVPVAQGPSISLREFRIVRTGWTLDEAPTRLTRERRRTDPGAGPVTRGAVSAIETGLRGMGPDMAGALERVYELAPHTLSVQIRRHRGVAAG